MALVRWGERVISVDSPKNVDLAVVECDPGVKGNTASGGLRRAPPLQTPARSERLSMRSSSHIHRCPSRSRAPRNEAAGTRCTRLLAVCEVDNSSEYPVWPDTASALPACALMHVGAHVDAHVDARGCKWVCTSADRASKHLMPACANTAPCTRHLVLLSPKHSCNRHKGSPPSHVHEGGPTYEQGHPSPTPSKFVALLPHCGQSRAAP